MKTQTGSKYCPASFSFVCKGWLFCCCWGLCLLFIRTPVLSPHYLFADFFCILVLSQLSGVRKDKVGSQRLSRGLDGNNSSVAAKPNQKLASIKHAKQGKI